MGSTFYSAQHSPKTYADEKKEVENIYSNGGLNEILQTSRVGNIWYMAVRVKETGEVFAGVCKIKEVCGFKHRDYIKYTRKNKTTILGYIIALDKIKKTFSFTVS